MITSQKLQDFRRDFNAMKRQLESQYGLTIELGNISYNSSGFTGKISAEELDSSCPYKSIAAQQAYKHAIKNAQNNPHCPFKMEWLGKRFTYHNDVYEVAGYVYSTRRGYDVYAVKANDHGYGLKSHIKAFQRDFESSLV